MYGSLEKARRVWHALGLVLHWLFPLASRLLVAHAFYEMGTSQWRHLENAAAVFRGVGIPAPELSVIVVAATERVGAVCLVLGLLVRPWALLLAAVSAASLATIDRIRLLDALRPDSVFGVLDVPQFVLLLLLLGLATYGAGPLALDGLRLSLAHRWRERRSRAVSQS